jgi:hypothetical protein
MFKQALTAFGLSKLAFALLFGMGFALVFIPFLVTDTEHAAEFFGAFTAAIVAAIAVILGAFYQAHLTRQRDESLRIAELIVEAKELFLWLEQSVVALSRASYRLVAFAEKIGTGTPPQVPLTYANFRVFLSPVSQEEAAARIRALAKFPIDLGLSVSSAIGTLASEHGPHNSKVVRDDMPINEEDFRHWAKLFQDAEAMLKVAQTQIAVVMHERYGAEFPISTDIAEAARRVHSLAVGK